MIAPLNEKGPVATGTIFKTTNLGKPERTQAAWPTVESQALTTVVSMVASATATATETATVDVVIQLIRDGAARAEVEAIRAAGQGDTAASLKRNLPGILWAGTFSRRAAAALEDRSGLLVIDLDDLAPETLAAIRAALPNDPHLLCGFVSPSGCGLKLVYRIDLARPHADCYQAAAAHVRETYGLAADPSGKDVSRLCFLSWDPELYVASIEPSPIPMPPVAVAPIPPAPATPPRTTAGSPPTADDCRRLLAAVPPRPPYHDWLRICSAVWSVVSMDEGCRLLAEWSPEELPGEYNAKYADRLARVNFGTLVHYAKAAGYGASRLHCGPEDWQFADGTEAAAPFPGAALMDETEATAPTLEPIPLFDIVAPDESSTAAKNLLGNGFLRRGQAGLINGPTGIGKSVLTTQAACCWSCGRHVFGIRPEKPLRILIVQSENDDADIAEMRDGIVAALGFTLEEVALIKTNVLCLRSFRSGKDWVAELDAIAEKHTPDLIIADPLFAYAGIDIAKDQPGLSKFLRGMIQPLVIKLNCGIIFIHHVNKPPTAAKDRSQWQAGDFAYSGSGHNELANWPRFVIALRSMGSRTVFELRIGKRSKRAGIVDDNGQPLDRVLVQHGETGIHWRTATQTDLARSMETQVGTVNPAKADEAGEIARIFHTKQKSGSIGLEDMARRMKVSPKTIRRRFGQDGILRDGDDVLTLANSVITLAVEEIQDDLL